MSDNEAKPERVVVQVYVENFNGTSGAAVVVRGIELGMIGDQVAGAAHEAATLAVADWARRRVASL